MADDNNEQYGSHTMARFQVHTLLASSLFLLIGRPKLADTGITHKLTPIDLFPLLQMMM